MQRCDAVLFAKTFGTFPREYSPLTLRGSLNCFRRLKSGVKQLIEGVVRLGTVLVDWFRR